MRRRVRSASAKSLGHVASWN
ncbi:hypothetical protein XFF7767_310027 [Xanthomonas citri pv. fuscans]|nr:hypothetical protein XFF6960_110027 [Xanthomonas citri pv. fuscans]SOO04809.1 hypothetical protein XFF7767_310027 [Xanthomonas citri pv. fuscans]SOO14255.1 hypothetical protein XFF7766_290034 [Xanthomonas citri pv. fuscans]SOO43372.1 hypothetical protein XFF1815_340036 [Xanthomonas citri pv. fuscans]